MPASPLEPILRYERIDPARYRVRLEAPTDGVLVFRESYNPYWRAGQWKPVVVDYYANGYLVPAGSHDFVVEHEPDEVYRRALVFVTVAPLVLLAGLLAMVVWVRRRATRS